MRKLVLCFAVFILISGTSCEDKPDKAFMPNILWIIADDLGTDLACYGTPLVRTPNLDQFAGEGCLYTGLFSVTAVCSPSRSTLVSGMYPVNIDCHQHRTRYKKPLPEGISRALDSAISIQFWMLRISRWKTSKALTNLSFVKDSS